MPDVFIRNETDKCLNVAFSFTAPCAFTNGVQPGATWCAHNMSSMLYPSFEVRIDQGDASRFSAGESWSTAGSIVGACALGTASVAVGAASFLGGLFGGFSGVARAPAGFATAGALMRSANAGGAAFAREKAGHVLRVGPVGIGFAVKHYVVRCVNGRWQVYDDDEKRTL